MRNKRQYEYNRKESLAILTAFLSVFIPVLLCFFVLFCVSSCSPRIITKTETVTEYRDRVVHDTATVEIPKIVEVNVTTDTTSHLENDYAESDAMVSQGLLHHSLSSRPKIIKVPVEVHVVDTLIKESEAITEVQQVEKKLTWFQRQKIQAFWWLVGALIAALIWIFRKPLKALIGIV